VLFRSPYPMARGQLVTLLRRNGFDERFRSTGHHLTAEIDQLLEPDQLSEVRFEQSRIDYPDVPSFCAQLHTGLKLDYWQKQPVYMEVLAQRQSMSGFYQWLSDTYGVHVTYAYMAMPEYVVNSMLMRFKQRYEQNKQLRMVLLALADHSPYGDRVVTRTAERFSAVVRCPADSLIIARAAVTREQADKLGETVSVEPVKAIPRYIKRALGEGTAAEEVWKAMRGKPEKGAAGAGKMIANWVKTNGPFSCPITSLDPHYLHNHTVQLVESFLDKEVLHGCRMREQEAREALRRTLSRTGDELARR
jgi:hypothetical protein